MYNNDFIRITGLQVYSYHGVFQEEKDRGQTFVVNADIYYDMSSASVTDRIDHAVSYADVCEYIRELLQGKNFDLIEAATEYVAKQLLVHFSAITKVEIELCKPNAPIGLPFENVCIHMVRSWHRVFLALGSNMGDKGGYLDEAVAAIQNHPEMRVKRVSKFIQTEPYGVTEQDDFLNGAMEMETIMEPMELLEYLHKVEAEAGRERVMRWGPRTLDLDIIFYDKLVMETKELIIPHIDMENRTFVLEPLAEIAPEFRHPIYQKTMQKMLCELKERNH